MKRAPTIPVGAAAAAAALLLAFAAGCDTLPEGDPPKGDLTDNSQPPVTTPLAMRNHLTTQLIVFALQNGVTELDPGSDPEALAIAVEASRTVGFRFSRNAPLRLELARSEGGVMELKAIGADGAEVWRSRRP